MVWPGQKLGLAEKSYAGTIPANAAFTVRDGRFTRRGLVPGRYQIYARASVDLWALDELEIQGQDIKDFVITLRPGIRVAGRLMSDDARKPGPADLSQVEVRLKGGADGMAFGSATVRATKDGSFSFGSVPPGNYMLEVRHLAAPPLALMSVTAGEQELPEALVTVRPNDDFQNLRLTLTTEISRLSGVVVDRLGRPTSEYFVAAIPADRSYWASQRRLRFVRCDLNGRYDLTDLPEGEYLVGAVTDMSESDLRDVAFLELLARMSTPIQIARGELKTLNLQLMSGEWPNSNNGRPAGPQRLLTARRTR
jgi:hypothetical protein